MPQHEPIGPHAEVESFLNYVAIYDRLVRRLLADTPKPPGVEYHLGVLQVALALEALLNRLYAEFIFPRLSSRTSNRGRERKAEARWLRAPQLIQNLRGLPRRSFDKRQMPYRGLVELIELRNEIAHPRPFTVTGKLERPFISDGDPNDHLPRRTFWDRQEWPVLRIHKHPECVSRSELEMAHHLFLDVIQELSRLTDNLVTLEWATTPVYRVTAFVVGPTASVSRGDSTPRNRVGH